MQDNRIRFLIVVALALGVVLFSRSQPSLTGSDGETTTLATEMATAPPPVHVDSARTIEEESRLFRAVIGEPATMLTGGAASRDELVHRFLDALEREDREALRSLHITVEEFAYLYYPHSRYTAPPYELPPGLVWMQLEGFGNNGIGRALNRVGGRPLGRDYRCPEEPVTRGDAHFWNDCLVTIPDVEGGREEIKLFSEIMERDGTFKFVSFGNSL